MSNYTELFNKAQKDLENVKAQKVQVKTKMEQLIEELDLDKSQPLEPQLEELKKTLELKKNEYTAKLDELSKKLKELE